MLYNVFVCMAIFLAGLFTYYKLKKNISSDFLITSFSYFWLTMGIMWFFTGLRTLFSWAGREAYDRAIFYIVTLFMLIQIVFLAGYVFAVRIKKKSGRKTVIVIYCVLCLLYLFFFFKDGFIAEEKTYWGTEWLPGKTNNFIFQYLLFTPVIIIMLINPVVEIYSGLKKNKEGIAWPVVWAHFAILIYAAVGYIDAKGLVAGWQLLLTRVFIMVACLIGYLCFAEQENET